MSRYEDLKKLYLVDQEGKTISISRNYNSIFHKIELPDKTILLEVVDDIDEEVNVYVKEESCDESCEYREG